MSSVGYLKEFVNERLTAAAAEIFRVFEKTIVQYEEELDRQRRLLDIVWKPEIKLHKIELPHQHVCQQEEEYLTDQQLCIQERSSSLDQEDPEPPQIKEEQEQLCISQEGEQLELKQETETTMLTPANEESEDREAQTLHLSINEIQSAVQEKRLSYVFVKRCVVSRPKSALHIAESQDKKGDEHRDSESTTNAEPKPTKRLIKNRTPRDERPYSCNTCGKKCRRPIDLRDHMRIHTGEKPYMCKTCGKYFRFTSNLTGHMQVHTGVKPYPCKTCGKYFARKHSMLVHIRRVHTGEKPYICNICGTGWFDSSDLAKHMKLHTDQ